jgi:hypothetical protein
MMLVWGTGVAEAGITLLTYPTLPLYRHPWLQLKRLLKMLGALVRGRPERALGLWRGGHPSVTRSLLAGLRTLGVPCNLNPLRQKQVFPWVLVLSGLEALEQAIRLKNKGLIQVLWAGPNLVVTPTGSGSVLHHPAIDRVVVPSDWVLQKYAGLAPALEQRLVVWPAGVDCEGYWKPRSSRKGARDGSPIRDAAPLVLLFNKLNPRMSSAWEPLLQTCIQHIQQQGWRQHQIRYGQFSQASYRRWLQRADLVIYWSDEGESQGLALAEAWAMDVPTLVSANHHACFAGVPCSVSTAPYLTPSCGALFSTWQQLQQQLDGALGAASSPYAPRQWVQQNLSDAASAAHLMALAQQHQG